MIDAKKELVSKLNEILPTYYEYFANSETEKPCITYCETNNYDGEKSMEMGYSTVQMTIKIWGKTTDLSSIQAKAELVDDAMRELGYSRVQGNELIVDNYIEKVLLYEALGFEFYNN